MISDLYQGICILVLFAIIIIIHRFSHNSDTCIIIIAIIMRAKRGVYSSEKSAEAALFSLLIIQVNEKFYKLERVYRDCIKMTRDKTRIQYTA